MKQCLLTICLCLISIQLNAEETPDISQEQFECGGYYINPTLDKSGQLVDAVDSIPINPVLGEYRVLVIMCRFVSQGPSKQVEFTIGPDLYKHPDPVTPEGADTLIFDNRYPAPFRSPEFL